MLTDFKNLRVLWDGQFRLGEGPLYCPTTESVYWVNILGSALHRVSLTGGAHTSWQFASAPTSIHHHAAGGFILTMQKGFARWQGDDAPPTPLPSPETDLPGNRFNDAKTDGAGRLWAGTMDNAEADETGALYRLDTDGTWQTIDNGYCITNGPAFSPCGRWLYHTNTVKREIYRFALAADGSVSDKTTFIRITPDHGYPDGMTVSQDGDIWVCHFFGGRISRYGSDGQLKCQFRLPVSNITSCAFVGPGLTQLAITTARKALTPEQLEREPLAGALFLADVDDAVGVPVRAYGR